MKLQLISDIHTKMASDKGKALVNSMNPEGIDFLVLAGDIMPLYNLNRCKETIGFFVAKGYTDILYVPGNHDYWQSIPKEAEANAKRLEDEFKGKFNYLSTGKVIELKGKRFLGDTMWFPENYWTERNKKSWPDFHFITDSGIPRNNREWFYENNAKFKRFLEQELKEGDIVVTHHLPSKLSTPARFLNDPYNFYYMSPMEDLIKEKKPLIWCHGHTHDFCDYKIETTRIICNPQGYPQVSPPPAKGISITV